MRKHDYWVILYMLGSLAVVCALWAAFPSSVFIRDAVSTVDAKTGNVTLFRQTPFGAVSGRFLQEITVVHANNFECRSAGWEYAVYQPEAGNAITYHLGDWADPCLELGPPFVFRSHRQVTLFGLLRLRPETEVIHVE